MKNVRCPNCGFSCRKHGRSNAGSQRWICKQCKCSFTNIITKDEVELQMFLKWLFGKNTQNEMPGQGRSFRRKTARFWELCVNVNIRMYNFDDVQCTVIPSVAYGFVTGMNLQLC